MLKTSLKNVRENHPLIHNITNYVTVNDCANILLAIGASPIMSDEPMEVEQITSICNGLNINIGTLNERTIEAMFKAATRSRELGHPILLDPVGAGASELRTEVANRLLFEIKPNIVRANASELKALAYGSSGTRGVDADANDTFDASNMGDLKAFAREHNTIVVVTGAIDIATDGERLFTVSNGHPIMSSITGSGCMLSALMTAFAAANPNDMLLAAVAALCAMGTAGELAFERLMNIEHGGNSTFRNLLIDEIYCMSEEKLERMSAYEAK